MDDHPERLLSILALYAEEHYAHARDHEHLRAQVTAILAAAGIVSVGLVLGPDSSGATYAYAAVWSVALSMLNLWLIQLHTNRFDMHVETAQRARWRMTTIATGDSWRGDDGQPEIDPCGFTVKEKKKGSLVGAWRVVATLPTVSVAMQAALKALAG